MGELDVISAQTINQFTASNTETIQCVLIPNRNIYYEGKIQSFYDVSGNIVYPLSYAGTTYLPVRAISNLFDLNINWDENTNTISIYNNITTTNDTEILPPSAVSLVNEAKTHTTTMGYTNDTGIWKLISSYGTYDSTTGTFNDQYSPVYIKQRKLYTGTSAEEIIENYNNNATFSKYSKLKEDNNLYILLYDVDLSDFNSSFITSVTISPKIVEIDIIDMVSGKLGNIYGVTYCTNPNELILNKGINQMFVIFETPKDIQLSAAKIKFVNEDDFSYETFFISTIN